MPASDEIARSNRTQTERLRTLARRLTPEMLVVRLPRGWTVAVAQTHIAFWDRQRLCLMRCWAPGDSCQGGYDGDVFNEVLLPFLEMVSADHVAALAVETAEVVDAFLLAVPDEVVEATLARPDRPNLDRGMHREYHLDWMGRALAGNAYSKHRRSA